jgi:hypothetical protein
MISIILGIWLLPPGLLAVAIWFGFMLTVAGARNPRQVTIHPWIKAAFTGFFIWWTMVAALLLIHIFSTELPAIVIFGAPTAILIWIIIETVKVKREEAS